MYTIMSSYFEFDCKIFIIFARYLKNIASLPLINAEAWLSWAKRFEYEILILTPQIISKVELHPLFYEYVIL